MVYCREENCVKSRYDGKGLECAKMGKRSKGRQGKGEKVIRDGRERLWECGAVQIGKGRGSCRRVAWQQDGRCR